MVDVSTMGSKLSKARHRDSSPLSRARKQLAFREPPDRPKAPKPPKEYPPLRILEWPIRESKPSEDPWLPGWYGPRLPQWLLWVPVEVARPPEYPEPRPTTRTAYIRCLENRAIRWHEWRYPHKREFDLRYGLDRAEEAEMIASLNDTAYAQRELLGDDWTRYEVVPHECPRSQGPPADGSVPYNMPLLKQKRLPPYWLFYPAGPSAYEMYPGVDPEELWLSILRRRTEKWHRWNCPDRHEFRKRFERYEPDGHGGRGNPEGGLDNAAGVDKEAHDAGSAAAAAAMAGNPTVPGSGSTDEPATVPEDDVTANGSSAATKLE